MDYNTHVLREDNTCADNLANLGSSLPDLNIFENSNILKPLISLVNLDKIGFSYIWLY